MRSLRLDATDRDEDLRHLCGSALSSSSFCQVKHRPGRKVSPRLKNFFADVQGLPSSDWLRDNYRMGFWSWLRSLWPSHENGAGSQDDVPLAADDDAKQTDQASTVDNPPTASTQAPSGDAAAPRMLYGTIEDYDALSQTGLVTLADGATLGFGKEECQDFTPLIGVRVAIYGTRLPPESALHDAADRAGLWACRMMLWPGSESEYAARLRIHQVERALRGAGERGESAPGEPPWARGKNRPGRKPSGPGRPKDAFFVLTLVLEQELAQDAAALSALIDPLDVPNAHATAEAAADPQPARRGGVWRRPSVRIIPLIRNQQSEAGFSAELQSGPHRAFLLYRPQPYGDEGHSGRTHVGLFVGGPHSPRVAAQLSQRDDQAPVAVTHDAARILADLARAFLLAQPDAPGVVLNRAGKAFKPRDIALSQLGDEPTDHLPFVFWMDWNRGERAGRPFLVSSGLEIVSLPDLAVSLATVAGAEPAADDAAEARARDVMLYVCDALLRGAVRTDQSTVAVPRTIRLLPGSRLEIAAPSDCETYILAVQDADWIELSRAAEQE